MDSSKSNGVEDVLVKQQLQHIKNSVLKHLFKYDPSWPFRKPVDTVALKLHDYFEIIKQPMDLGTIKKKLNQKKYANAQACIDDFRLMFTNCYTYNRPSDDVITYCKSVENYFNQLIKRMPMEVKPSKRGRGRTPATSSATASSSPKQVRKSNGSISASSPLRIELPVKSETKPKVASIDSLVATVVPPSKHSTLVNNNQVESKSSFPISTPKVTLTNALDPRSTPMLETKPTVVEHTTTSFSKLKKSMKRKTEDELPETKKPLKVKVEGETSLEVEKSLKRKADDKEIFDVRKSIKRKLNEEQLRSSIELSVSSQIKSPADPRPAVKQQRKESANDEMPDLTNARKLSSDAMTYCYNVLLNMIADQPDEPDASQLYKCVEPNAPGMENYYQIVKRPMDLVTVKKNLEGGVYTEIKQFAADVRQVFSNCYRYNVNNNRLVKIARDLQNFFEVRYARAPEENESTPLNSMKHDVVWPDHSQGSYSMSKRSQSTSSSSSSDDTACKKADHDDEIELLQQQLLQAQERISSLQSTTNTPSVKKEKKPKQKLKVVEDLFDRAPSPVIQSMSKPPPMPSVEEIPIAAPAVVEPLPKPAKPAKAKPLSHKKAAQKPVMSAVVAEPDIPDPVPPAPLAAAALEPDFRQDLKRLAALLPQLPDQRVFHCLRMIYGMQPDAIQEDSQNNLAIVVEKLNRSAYSEINAYLEKYLEDEEESVSEKKSEQKKHPEALVEPDAEDDLNRKTGTLDDSPVLPAGHLLPQQPMRPSNTATPKPTPKVLSGTSASTSGSQVRHPAPEPISAPSPLLPPAASKPAAATHHDRNGSPLIESPNTQSISPKHNVLPEKKPVFIVADEKRTYETSVPKTEPIPPIARMASIPVTSARPASSAGKPSSSSSSPPPASVPKKSAAAKIVSNSTEDSSSPIISSKPGSSIDLASAKTQLLSAKSVPASVGPFGIDTSKPTTPKEAVLKPSASSWSFLNLKANSKAPTPKAMPQQNVNASFNHYKELAKQRNASEKLQEKEKERQKMESEERERKKREDQKAKDEEEALMQALNNSERTAQAPPAVDNTPKETSAERQAKLKEQERLREQQRRRMEAQSNKIDMNFQSDLLASFEHTLKNPS